MTSVIKEPEQYSTFPSVFGAGPILARRIDSTSAGISTAPPNYYILEKGISKENRCQNSFERFHPLMLSNCAVREQAEIRVSIWRIEDDANILDTIRYDYKIIDDQSVGNFVCAHFELLPILFEAPSKILPIFGSDSRLELKVVSDPEEGSSELFIVVKSNFSAMEACRRMDRVLDEWFLDVMPRTKGLLNVTEEPA